MVVGYNWSLTQLNAELPEELRSLPMLQGSDTSSLSTGTSAQNGLGGSSVSSGGDVLQRTQMLDVAGSQNHQQSSQLLAAAQSSAYGMPSVVSRHATIGVDCTTSATAATNIANPGNPVSDSRYSVNKIFFHSQVTKRLRLDIRPKTDCGCDRAS